MATAIIILGDHGYWSLYVIYMRYGVSQMGCYRSLSALVKVFCPSKTIPPSHARKWTACGSITIQVRPRPILGHTVLFYVDLMFLSYRGCQMTSTTLYNVLLPSEKRFSLFWRNYSAPSTAMYIDRQLLVCFPFELTTVSRFGSWA